jgi:hypothetical protein
MSTYDRFYKSAVRLLGTTGLGASGTINRMQDGVYNPVTGGVTTSTPVTLNISGVRIGYKDYYINGDTILDTDVNLYIKPTTQEGVIISEIKSSDKITFDGTTYTVVDVKPWNFNGMSIGFKVHARIAG